MFKHFLAILLSMLLLPAAVASPPQISSNLITNASFEFGLADWTTDGNALLNSSVAHSGSFSAGGMQDNFVQRNFQPIAVGLVHELSFWAHRQGGPIDNIVFYYSDNSSSWGLANGLGRGNDWMRFDITAQLQPGKELTGFRVIGTTPGPVFFDDFTLTTVLAPVPEPGTFLMLLAGLGLFSLARMRRQTND